MRPWQVWRHRLGTPAADDVLVYQEDDERFYTSVGRTRTGRYIVVSIGSKITSEAWFSRCRRSRRASCGSWRRAGPASSTTSSTTTRPTRATASSSSRTTTAPRTSSSWSPRSNARVASTGARWSPHRADVRLEDVDAFAGSPRAVRAGRSARADPSCDASRTTTPTSSRCPTPCTRPASAPTPSSTRARCASSTRRSSRRSRATTTTSRPAERTLVKRQPVLAATTRTPYESHRLWATAPDGTRVPDLGRPPPRSRRTTGPRRRCCTATARTRSRSTRRSRSARLSLLERGVVFAIAHIRGGGELGRRWYEDGQARAQAQHVHRLHRRAPSTSSPRATRLPTGWRRAAGAPAGC